MSRSEIHRQLRHSWSSFEHAGHHYPHSARLEAILQKNASIRAAAAEKMLLQATPRAFSSAPSPAPQAEPPKVGIAYEEDGDTEVYGAYQEDEEMEDVPDDHVAYTEDTGDDEDSAYKEGDDEGNEQSQPSEAPKSAMGTSTTTAYQAISSEDSCDWAGRFRALDHQIKTFPPSETKEKRIEVNESLMRLASDFLLSAEMYGKTIISEVFLDLEEKTIKPVAVGGAAGGEKYIIRNILFKFALDFKGLYNGDENAAKAAGHELKAVMSYHGCFMTNFNLPLMAVIDYRGFRLVAMSLLPIRPPQGRLIYGSDDMGRTVHDDVPEFSEKMKIAAQKLNLAGHTVAGKYIYAAFDVEGHESNGQFYLLDLARTFPPELALPDERPNWPRNAFLYRLLRAELVKKSEKPLCSDAGTKIQQCDPNWKEYNKDVREVKRKLREEIIPQFAVKLADRMAKTYALFETGVQAKIVGPLLKRLTNPGSKWNIAREKTFRAATSEVFGESFPLKQAIHAEGINLRHMGYIVQEILKLPAEKEGRSHALAIVYTEMFARTIRKEIHAMFRRQMKSLSVPLEEPYRMDLVDNLNTVFGSGSKSKVYWTRSLKDSVIRKFGAQSFTREQLEDPAFDLRRLIAHRYPRREDGGQVLLFLRLKKLMGFSFDEITENAAVTTEGSFYNQNRPFDVIDLRAMGARVKHMGVVNHARGYIYKMRGSDVRVSNPSKAITFLQKARENFEEVLESSPNSAVTLRNLGQVLQQIETITAIRQNPDCSHLDMSAEGVLAAHEYYLRAVQAGPFDTHSLYQYAQFLAECGELDEAEEQFLRSLEAAPSHVAALVDYAFLLNQRGFSKEASRVLETVTEEQIQSMYPVVEPSLFHRKISAS